MSTATFSGSSSCAVRALLICKHSFRASRSSSLLSLEARVCSLDMSAVAESMVLAGGGIGGQTVDRTHSGLLLKRGASQGVQVRQPTS